VDVPCRIVEIRKKKIKHKHGAINAMVDDDAKCAMLEAQVQSPTPPPKMQNEFIFNRMLRTMDHIFRRPFHPPLMQSSIETRSDVNFKGPLLYGTSNYDQHHAMITTALHVFHLYQQGDEITRCSHNECEVDANDTKRCFPRMLRARDRQGGLDEIQNAFDQRARNALRSLGFEFRANSFENDRAAKNCDCDGSDRLNNCLECVTRLYHMPSNTFITKENRQSFIADGKMYDAVADLCQAVAQEIMAETYDLVWVTLCDGRGGGLHARHQEHHDQVAARSKSMGNVQNPIRALVGRNSIDANTSCPRDTFLIATGKGKVRAGIFSRHHLLTTGLEPSTALPLLYEARKRGMNCVVIDPNARGDGVGMNTFEISLRGLFEQNSKTPEEYRYSESAGDFATRAMIPTADVDGPIYVLAHSAAGGQLVRYLLAQPDGKSLLSRLRCITFTDSTHSIQWLKKHPHISSLIESSMALYLRSANPMRDDEWENASPGDECPGDHFWSHRFGKTKTVWAGK
jgi:hypothetical protein